MSRLGYILCACMMLGLLYFIVWSDDPDRMVFIFPEPLSTPFTLESAVGTQYFDGTQLSVDGVPRPPNHSKIKNLGKFLKRMRVKAEFIRDGVGADQLAAYGLDGRYELRYADQRYRWAVTDGSGYVWHEQTQRLYVLRAKVISELIKTYAHRMDQRQLIELRGTVVQMHFNNLILERVSEAGGWLAPEQPHRPAFNARGDEILRQLRGYTLENVHGVEKPETAKEIFQITLACAAPNAGPDHIDQRLSVIILQDAQDSFIQVAEQPLQRLSARQWQALDEVCQACNKDYLLDIAHAVEGLPFNCVVVENKAGELYRLQRLGTEDEAYNIPGYSYWELVWPGGREAAMPNVGVRFFNVLNNLVVDDVRLQPNSAMKPAADEIAITCLDESRQQRARVFWSAQGVVRSLFHHGQLQAGRSGPRLSYAELIDPAQFLNNYVLPVDMRRVEKVQRIIETPAFQGELLQRQSLTQWQLSFYDAPGSLQREEPGDAIFCNRLASAISHLQAERVQFADEAGRQRFAQAQRRIDVRLSAWDIQSGEDEYFLEETLARDWGMQLIADGDEWLGLNHDETLIYSFTASSLDPLFADVRSGYILSVVPNQIQQMRLRRRGADQFVLNRNGRIWETQYAGAWHAADPLQMRLFLRDLSRCQAQRIDDQLKTVHKDDIQYELQLFVPGYEDRNEQITISIGTAVDGLYPCSVLTTSGIQALAGVAWCSAAAVEPLMQDHAWFVPSSVQEQASDE